MHQIRFTPDPAGGAYSAPSDPLAGLRGPTSKGRGGKGRGEERKGRERGGEGKGGGRRGEALAVEPSHFSTGSDATAIVVHT